MASESEQTRRRRTTSSYEPNPLIMSQKPQADVSSQTGYRFDEGMTGPPRSSTSVVRYTSDGVSQRPTSSQTSSGPVVQRRQTMTKEFPQRSTARQTQQNQQGRQTQQQTTQGRQTQQQSSAANRQPRQARMMAPPTTPISEKIKHRDIEVEPPRKKVHWLLPAGVGMMFMLVIWVMGSSILGWATQEYYNFRYGSPRTFQTDAVVGHNKDSVTHPSHFLAINLNHQIIIIELMAGDPSKSVSYYAPLYLFGNDENAPVTLEFKDVTGDGKPDMIVRVLGSSQYYVFVNDGSKFRPPTSTDKIQYSS